MKVRMILILLFICICTCIYVITIKNDSFLTCTNTFHSETKNVVNEKVEIKFLAANKAKRTIVADMKSKDKDISKKALKSLKQNYCNSEIKKDYSCNGRIEKNKIIIVEEGTAKDLMGVVKGASLKDYKKMLEDKGFKCKKK